MSEAILNSNSPEVATENMQQMLDLIRDMFAEIHHTASTSANLHSLNIQNEWADSIQEMINSPVKASFEAYKSIQDSINQSIQEQFKDFLSSKLDLIEKVFLAYENKLQYAIILKENTLSSKAEILEYKLDYDETPIGRTFPLIITFLDLEMLEGANIDTEISFG